MGLFEITRSSVLLILCYWTVSLNTIQKHFNDKNEQCVSYIYIYIYIYIYKSFLIVYDDELSFIETYIDYQF